MVTEKKYDLEERTLKFTKACVDLCKIVVKDVINLEFIKQLMRASGSVGANYREANESMSKKDFYHRIKICRKEAKESRYWLEILRHANEKYGEQISGLVDEATQLTKIFGSIIANQP